MAATRGDTGLDVAVVTGLLFVECGALIDLNGIIFSGGGDRFIGVTGLKVEYLTPLFLFTLIDSLLVILIIKCFYIRFLYKKQ